MTHRREIEQAYEVIFGPIASQLDIGPIEISPQDLSSAFKKRALETHPDRAELLGFPKGLMEERFKRVSWAYTFLKNHLEELALPQPTTVRPARRRPAPSPAAETRRPRAAPRPPSARRVRLGEFLVRAGLISWVELVQALSWQRRNRTPIGQLAVAWDMLTSDQVVSLLRERNRERAFRTPFCEFAVQKGLLSPFQQLALLGRQRGMNRPLGLYFIEQGWITPEDMELLVQACHLQNQQTYR